MRPIILFLISITLLVGCSFSDDLMEHDLPSLTTPEKPSSLFDSNGYSLIGEKGEIGFIYDETETMRFYPNKIQKYMWHLWGNPEELHGDFFVKGKHIQTGEQVNVLYVPRLGGPINGADAHTPSHMSLPLPGLWKLEAYVGNMLHGSIIVEVHERKTTP